MFSHSLCILRNFNNHRNLSEGDCEVGPTFALSFVAPSGIEPESRASETLILSIEL